EAIALRPTLDAASRAARALLDDWDGRSVLLHGDLESSNILVCSRRGLAAVDPLPSIGDPAFDAGYLAAQAPIEEREELSARLGLALTGTAAKASIVASACWLPVILLQLPAGIFADRWNGSGQWLPAISAARLLPQASSSLWHSGCSRTGTSYLSRSSSEHSR